jgi:hypothetical protein
MGLFKKIKRTVSQVQSAVSDAFDTAEDQIDTAADDVKTAFEQTWDQIEDAADDAKAEIGDVLTHAFTSGLAPLLLPPIMAYWGTLAVQAKGRERTIPMPFRALLQPYFSYNLAQVRYAERIHTVGDNAVTFGQRIYFPRGINLDRLRDLHWLVHELRHVQQYHDHGGVVPFLHAYVTDIGRVVTQTHTFRVHDLLQLEMDAEAYASVVDALVHWKSRMATFEIFQPGYYLSQHADLQAALGNNPDAARNHWAEYGIREGRRSSPAFDVRAYLERYADVRAAVGEDYNAAIDHWITYGKSEQRNATPEPAAAVPASIRRLETFRRYLHPVLEKHG